MKQKIYVIATDELVGPEYTDTETRICHNLGFFNNEDSAKIACVGINAREMGDADDPEKWEDIYYVLPIELRD